MERHRPDVALVDIRMPPTGTNEGLVAAEHIGREYPEVAVLVLSQYLELAYAVHLVENGEARRGYLLKDRVSDIEVLLDADPPGRARRNRRRPGDRRGARDAAPGPPASWRG